MIGSTLQGHTYYGNPVKLEKYGNAGSWGQLWEESEMMQQRKIDAGTYIQAQQPRGIFLGPHGLGGEEPQTSISFPEMRHPVLVKGGKEGLCVFVGVLRDFGILMKTLSHYSKSV